MSDAKLIAALQRQASEAEVERLRLVEQVKALHRIAWPRGGDLNGDPEYDLRLMVGTFQCTIRDLEAQLAASHLAAQRMSSEAVAEEREAWRSAFCDLYDAAERANDATVPAGAHDAEDAFDNLCSRLTDHYARARGGK